MHKHMCKPPRYRGEDQRVCAKSCIVWAVMLVGAGMGWLSRAPVRCRSHVMIGLVWLSVAGAWLCSIRRLRSDF